MSFRDLELSKRLDKICRQHGYEQVLKEVAALWHEQDGNASKVIGARVYELALCECDEPKTCLWCCGTGYLPEHVKKIKDSQPHLEQLYEELQKFLGRLESLL